MRRNTHPVSGTIRHPARIITQLSRVQPYAADLARQQRTPPQHEHARTAVHPTFAFLVHPLIISDISKPRFMRFARHLPQHLVERVAAYAPPVYLSRIRGIRSAATGELIEGVLYTLGSTPAEMLRHPPEFTYRRVLLAAHAAQRRGARLLGLGAFTSVVGDAGVSIAERTPVGITSGNTLTVVATLQTVRHALALVGHTPEQSRVAIIGATGSIGAACSRLLAREMQHIWLVAPRHERLLALQEQIERETPRAQISISTDASHALPQVELVILTTSSLSDSVIDVGLLAAGAVVCDVARPPNINPAAARHRPDVLFIESGEVILPGQLNTGFDLKLPTGSAYACLAETALLAMAHRYGDYTVGRVIAPQQVDELSGLMQTHGLTLAPLRSFGRDVSDAAIEQVRMHARTALTEV